MKSNYNSPSYHLQPLILWLKIGERIIGGVLPAVALGDNFGDGKVQRHMEYFQNKEGHLPFCNGILAKKILQIILFKAESRRVCNTQLNQIQTRQDI